MIPSFSRLLLEMTDYQDKLILFDFSTYFVRHSISLLCTRNKARLMLLEKQ